MSSPTSKTPEFTKCITRMPGMPKRYENKNNIKFGDEQG